MQDAGVRTSLAVLFVFAACGDNGTRPSPDAAVDAAFATAAGDYGRVVPGYTTEEECRAMNPDPLFACRELLSLCAGGRAMVLFTDIVFDGDWVEDATSVTITFDVWSSAFSMDGTTVFVRQPGSLASDEVYGDRAFTTAAAGSSLCP